MAPQRLTAVGDRQEFGGVVAGQHDPVIGDILDHAFRDRRLSDDTAFGVEDDQLTLFGCKVDVFLIFRDRKKSVRQWSFPQDCAPLGDCLGARFAGIDRV